MQDQIVEWAREIQSLAQAGLHYGKDVFDRERYERLRSISAEMMASRTGLPMETVRDLFCADSGYQTPKVDTRAAIFRDGKVLLVRERSGKWSMPGGWCEYNLSPAENTKKEAKEEAGLDVRILKLAAVQDRDRHNAPRYACKVIKIFFLCEPIGGTFVPNSETSESRYFPLDSLPVLAEEKCTREQILMCFQAMDEHWTVRFD